MLKHFMNQNLIEVAVREWDFINAGDLKLQIYSTFNPVVCEIDDFLTHINSNDLPRVDYVGQTNGYRSRPTTAIEYFHPRA